MPSASPSVAYPALALYIDGEWFATASGGAMPVINPADETVLGNVPLAGARELDAALEAAARGFARWKKTSALERQKTISRATQLLRDRAPAIAVMLTAARFRRARRKSCRKP